LGLWKYPGLTGYPNPSLITQGKQAQAGFDLLDCATRRGARYDHVPKGQGRRCVTPCVARPVGRDKLLVERTPPKNEKGTRLALLSEGKDSKTRVPGVTRGAI